MQPSTGWESKRTAQARSRAADTKSRKWNGGLSPLPSFGHCPPFSYEEGGRPGWVLGSSRSSLYLSPHLCPGVTLIRSHVGCKVCMLKNIRIVQRENFLQVRVSDPIHHILVG